MHNYCPFLLKFLTIHDNFAKMPIMYSFVMFTDTEYVCVMLVFTARWCFFGDSATLDQFSVDEIWPNSLEAVGNPCKHEIKYFRILK